MTPERPVLRYFGGKWILAPWIISHFHPHRVYVEPFGGAASVLMRKPRADAEIYNDLDSDVVNLFRILRNPTDAAELEKGLRLTPFARDEFNQTYEPPTSDLDRARLLIIRSFMGFGSNSCNMAKSKTGFRANSNQSGTTPAHDWAKFPNQIKAFTERLLGVVIENKDAKLVMAQHDSPDTLHFVDPPYLHETRGTKDGYKHEMTDGDHAELIEFLKTLTGSVVLCGYASPAYESLGWHSVSREALADGARARTEVLWMNPRAWDGQSQMSLIGANR